MKLSVVKRFLCGIFFPFLGMISPSSLLGVPTTVSVPDIFPVCPISYVTGTMLATDGSLWVIGENASIYRLDAGSRENDSWLDLRYFKNFPNTSDFRCIVQDKQGRIWVGTDHSGVAVFNGEEWKTYTQETVLLGDRVYALAVSPLSGEIAIASSGGVTIYNPKDESWKDLTRADGLVSDQVSSLCFDKKGMLWVAYHCGGVSYSSSQNRYLKWKTIQSKWYWDEKQNIRQPETPSGEGLPSNLCNVIMEGHNGSILLATCGGLAWTSKTGNWQYMRGADYNFKNEGVFGAKISRNKKRVVKNDYFLKEDYVSALQSTEKGIFVGFRSYGAILLDHKTHSVIKDYGKDKRNSLSSQFVTTIVAYPNGTVLAGTYGKGLVMLERGKKEWTFDKHEIDQCPPFPKEPSVLSMENLTALGENKLHSDKRDVFFWKEDWNTKGDWCERYGRDYALLCATNAPRDDYFYSFPNQKISVVGKTGANQKKGEGLRHWIHWGCANNNENVLRNIMSGIRTEAEWDDHGENYARSFDGPDVWAFLSLPQGWYHFALYFYNPNGHEKNPALRDYLIEVRKFPLMESPNNNYELKDTLEKGDISKLTKYPVLARSRVNFFTRSGVYKSFLAKGGCLYAIRICKNNSFNTILNGIFVTKLLDGKGNKHVREHPSRQYCNIYPKPPSINGEETTKGIINIFDKVAKIPANANDASRSEALKTYIYRTAVKNGEKLDTIKFMRWHLNLWNQEERNAMEELMAKSWFNKQERLSGIYCSSLVFPKSPRVIPFTPLEIFDMKLLGIEWKSYLPGSSSEPPMSVDEMKKKSYEITKSKNRFELYKQYKMQKNEIK